MNSVVILSTSIQKRPRLSPLHDLTESCMPSLFHVCRALFISILATSALTSLMSGCTKSSTPTEAVTPVKPTLTVTTIRPEALAWPAVIHADGDIAPWQEVVVAATTGGVQLTALNAEIGDRVARDQVLALLDQRSIQADVHQAEAGVQEAQANLRLAAADGARARALAAGEVLNAQQQIQYEVSETAAKARLAAAEARLANERLRLEHASVRAPDDGIIISRAALLGSVPQVGTELFRLLRQGRCEWRAEILVQDLPRLRPGQQARLILPGGDSALGTVRLVGPAVDPGKRTGLVYVDLPIGSARPGSFASGDITLGEPKELLTIASSAVVLREGRSLVFTVDDQQKVHEVRVDLGQRQGARVAITPAAGTDPGALTPASRVVASGGGFLADGDLVSVMEAAATEKAPGKTPVPAAAP